MRHRGPNVGHRGLNVGHRGPNVGHRGPNVGHRGPNVEAWKLVRRLLKYSRGDGDLDKSVMGTVREK